ncbi:MAG: sigma-70 family RNA polymerase sigma factor [Bacteroidota bacterium]
MKNLRVSHKAESTNTRPSPQSNKFEDWSERDIWMAFRQGDPDAFQHIYETYFALLFNYASQFTSDREAVKDLLQDLFIEIRERRERLASVDSINFYLKKCLRNRITKLIRRGLLVKRTAFGNEHSSFAVALSPETHVITSERTSQTTQLLDRALSKLSVRQREVLIYYYYEGLNYDQITELMGFSNREHARKLVYRAISSLRSSLKKHRSVLFSLIWIVYFLIT